jgi:hypothetical protein
MELSQKDIRFLTFGYFLENSPGVELKFTQNDKWSALNYSEALEEAGNLWRSTFHERYNASSSMEHVVPISGGVDSRALLLELLKYKEAKDIHTFTFGVKGSLDYEIGKGIARHYGTNHSQIDCSGDILTLKNAVEFGELVDFSCNLFLTPQVSALRQYKGMNIWTGTVIDVFFGRHFHEHESLTHEALALNFMRENSLTKHFGQFIDQSDLINMLSVPIVKGSSMEHTVDLANRQSKFVAKHLLYEGYNFSTMLGDEITQFALSIDQSFHIKQRLYVEMMQNIYPDFNKFPCKTSFGLKLSAPNYRVTLKRLSTKASRFFNPYFKDPYVNYLDWDKELSKSTIRRLDDSIGPDEYTDLMNFLCELNDKNGGYAMDILNLLSLRIIKNVKR